MSGGAREKDQFRAAAAGAFAGKRRQNAGSNMHLLINPGESDNDNNESSPLQEKLVSYMFVEKDNEGDDVVTPKPRKRLRQQQKDGLLLLLTFSLTETYHNITLYH